MKNIYKLLISIVLCQGVGLFGSFATMNSVSLWYETLTKPVLNPLSWVLGPVWITLYLLMAISLFLIWRGGIRKKQEKQAVLAFAVQLALNGTWSFAFFGAENPGLALVNIVLLLAAIVWTVVRFYPLDKRASFLLIPYLLWVMFATYLNTAIWILNYA